MRSLLNCSIGIYNVKKIQRKMFNGVRHFITFFFCSKHHKFHIGDNVDAILRLDDKFFNTKLRTKNGTHAIVVPIQSGVTQVEATLYGVVDNKGRKIPLPEKLTATAELTISSQVTISPHVLALPWDQNKKIRYTKKHHFKFISFQI